MRQMRLDSKEGLATGWAGVSDARNLPDRARAKSSVSAADPDASEPSSSRGLVRAVFRFARNAAVGLLLISAVPFAAVMVRSQHLTTQRWNDVSNKLLDAERARALTSAVDPSITPMEAGQAFAALQAPQLGASPNTNAFRSESDAQFPRTVVDPQPKWPWRAHKPGQDMFQTRTGGFEGPSALDVINEARSGFTPAEMEWLRELAEAPVWKSFDKVGRAQAVDLIGGQFQLPFRADAFSLRMPVAKFTNTKELAYAGVARAAYYVALGQPELAEAALRSVVSVGFALIDNGSFAIDGLIGKVMVGIGQNGFEQYAMYTGEFPAGYDQTPTPKTKAVNFSDPRGVRMTADEIREVLLKNVSDVTLPRTVRLEQLNQLSMSSCSNITEMWSGPRVETREAFASAASTLARFPSEQAQLELMLDATNRVPDSMIPADLGRRLVIGAATVAATVTGNPRLASCTRMAVGGS